METGEATYCKTCDSYTKYKDVCAVCEAQTEENHLKYVGNLTYLKAKYKGY